MFEITKVIADHLGSAPQRDALEEKRPAPATPHLKDSDSPRRMRGKVKWFNVAKGFGFITPDGDGRDVFVHHTAIQQEGFRSLSEGALVSFEVVQSPKGQQAHNVRLEASTTPSVEGKGHEKGPAIPIREIVREGTGVVVREAPAKQAVVPSATVGDRGTTPAVPSFELPADMRIVTVHFDGPERLDLFKARLQRAQVQVVNREDQVVAVVVGEEHGTLSRLWNLLRERAGLDTRFYSQQMFEAILRTGRDPYTSDDRQELTNVADTHASLKRILRDFGFDWPSPSSLTVPTDFSRPFSKSLSAMRDSSVLTALGYHTGQEARPPGERRKVLARAFEMRNYKLPRIDSPDYMVTWGDRRSKLRLKRMAEHLAMLIKLNQPQDRMRDAVRDWMSDLGWMKSEYYDRNPLFSSGRAGFLWPHV